MGRRTESSDGSVPSSLSARSSGREPAGPPPQEPGGCLVLNVCCMIRTRAEQRWGSYVSAWFSAGGGSSPCWRPWRCLESLGCERWAGRMGQVEARMALPPRRSRLRVRRAEAGPWPTRRRNYHHRFPETCIFQSVLPSFHTRVDVGGFAKRVSGHVSCHPPPAPRPPACERALFWKQPEALWSLGWRVEWVAVLRRPLSLAVRPFLQAGLGRVGDSVSKVAGASASWWGVQALGRPCAAWGRGVCSGSQFPGKAREGLWGPVLALPSSGVRDPPSRNPAGPPQFRGSSAGPGSVVATVPCAWLRAGAGLHLPLLGCSRSG